MISDAIVSESENREEEKSSRRVVVMSLLCFKCLPSPFSLSLSCFRADEQIKCRTVSDFLCCDSGEDFTPTHLSGRRREVLTCSPALHLVLCAIKLKITKHLSKNFTSDFSSALGISRSVLCFIHFTQNDASTLLSYSKFDKKTDFTLVSVR